MALSDRIRILLIKRGNISEAELARKLGVSPQNLNNKMKRDNFTEKDLMEIATALDCTFSVSFRLNDTGEEIQKKTVKPSFFIAIQEGDVGTVALVDHWKS